MLLAKYKPSLIKLGIKKATFFLLFIFSFRLMAQTEDSKSKDSILVLPEFHAEYPEGNAELFAFIKRNLVIPQKLNQLGIAGTTHLRLIIERDGSISSSEIVKGFKDCDECDSEALSVVKKMPKWKAARNEGKNVSSYFSLPVRFEPEIKLANSEQNPIESPVRQPSFDNDTLTIFTDAFPKGIVTTKIEKERGNRIFVKPVDNKSLLIKILKQDIIKTKHSANHVFVTNFSYEPSNRLVIPADSLTGKFNYTNVIEVPKSKSQLYKEVKEYALLNYTNKGYPVVLEEESERIYVKGTFPVKERHYVFPFFFKHTKYDLVYTMKIFFKDNKIKYEITDLFVQRKLDAKIRGTYWGGMPSGYSFGGGYRATIKESQVITTDLEKMYSRKNRKHSKKLFFLSDKGINNVIENFTAYIKRDNKAKDW